MKGRAIKMPHGVLRPAMDRMRESMFGVLGSAYSLPGKSFLDVFAGSGSVALEAASRGANPVFVIEKDLKKKPVLLANLKMAQDLGITLKPLFMAAERFFKAPIAENFDFIHLDPPFPLAAKTALLAAAGASKALARQGVLTIHYPKEDDLPASAGGLERYDLRFYGRSCLAFYRRTASPE